MIPSYKEIAELLKKGATLEAQEKIMELREAVMELKDESHALRSKVRELEEALSERDSVSFEGAVYWRYLENEAGDPTDRDGPFCPRCYDVDGKLVRMHGDAQGWRCKHCNRWYGQ